MAELIQQIINGVVMGGYYILIAIGLFLVYGVLQIPHFAHGSVITLGGFITYLLVSSAGANFFVAIFICIVISVAIGIGIERGAYRPTRNAPHINAFIVALGLGVLIENILTAVFGGNQVIIQNPFVSVYDIGGVHVSSLRVFMIVICFSLVVALICFMQFTKMGKAVRAASQNREASLMVGINTEVVTAVVFGLGAAFGAVAGSLVGALFAVYPALGMSITMKGFAVLILGGLGSIRGVIVGGLIIGLAESIGSMLISSEYKDVFAFAIMIIILVFIPSGMFGGERKQ
jgi:branched-chain amino acid transport system permease protein